MVPPGRLRIVLTGLFVFGVFTPFGVSWLGRGVPGTCLAIAGWASLTALPILLPLAEVKSGFVLGTDGATFRSEEPVMFWLGVATHFAVCLVPAAAATIGLYSYFEPAISSKVELPQPPAGQ